MSLFRQFLREHLLERRKDERDIEDVEALIRWLHRYVGEREGPFSGLMRQVAKSTWLPPSIQDQRIPENFSWPINPAWRDWMRVLAYFPAPLRPHEGAPSGKLLDKQQLSRLLCACLADNDASGFRDAAVFTTLYCTAASNFELQTLNLDGWIPEPPSLHLSSGVPMERGGKQAYAERVVPLTPEVANLLAGWVALRGRHPGDLFQKIDAYGNVLGQGFGAGTLQTVLKRRFSQAGLEQVYAEDLRRTGLTDLFRQGADLLTVANVAGHDSLRITQRYQPDPH